VNDDRREAQTLLEAGLHIRGIVVVANASHDVAVTPDVHERPGESRCAGIVPKQQECERFVHDLVL
jgi:hypothetical protein